MKKEGLLTSAMTVKEVLDRHPRALQAFVDVGLSCVGCPTEAFHTLAEVAREYHLDLNQLLQRIHRAIGDDEASSGLSPEESDGRSGSQKNQRDMV